MYDIEVLDISKYQSSQDGLQIFDFSKSVGKVQAFIFRSSIGSGTDYQLANYVDGARNYDFPFGFYHFAKPSHNWQTQASLFVSLIKQFNPELDVWLDVEVTEGLNKTAMHSWVVKFLTYVKERVSNKVGIYTSAGFWNYYLPRTDLGKEYLLWAASWYTNTPTLPYDWYLINNPNPKLIRAHQYGVYKDAYELGSKGDDDIDHNGYLLTINEFNTEFNTNIKPLGTVPIPPPVLTTKEVGLAKCIVPSLNVRKGPSTSYSVIEGLKRDNIVEVLEVREYINSTWYRIGFNQYACKQLNGTYYLMDI